MHYQRALTLSPRHRGAHEYVGEAYLIVNNLGATTDLLDPLREFVDLKQKIEAYKRSSQR
jgi:hypothetical protein